MNERFEVWKINDDKDGIKDINEKAYYSVDEIIPILNILNDDYEKIVRENRILNESVDRYSEELAGLKQETEKLQSDCTRLKLDCEYLRRVIKNYELNICPWSNTSKK